mgnify:FL=1|jgi:hypothetical protein|tara:strand:- start:51 stop:1379 length:1329 start_codon:yes stop_codon:yes gene_type:complete
MAITNTPEAEGAQALFCYIADVLGVKKTKTEFAPYIKKMKGADEFFDQHKKTIERGYSSGEVKTERSKSVIITYIEKNPEWFISSLKIAQHLITEIESIVSKNFRRIQAPKAQGIFYKHGDDLVMKGMSLLYKSANEEWKKAKKSTFFGNINKWSPADIYFATDLAKKQIKKMVDDPETKASNLKFATLNTKIGKLIQAGELLPLSLKQVKSKSDVVLKVVNFKRSEEEALLAETFANGVLPYKDMAGSYKVGNKSFKWVQKYSTGRGGYRDIYAKLKSGKYNGTLQFRHTPAASGKPSAGFKVVLKYDGASALGGQVTSFPILVEQIKINDPSFGKKMHDTFKTGYTAFEKAMKVYNEHGGGNRRYNPPAGLKYQEKKQLKDQFNADVGAISAITLMNPLRKIISDYFKKPNEKTHNVMRTIFAYVASRTIHSSPFVIAKD